MYPHLKVIQLFFKVFNHHGYMVGRCGEQFSEQVLLSELLYCQKTLETVPPFSVSPTYTGPKLVPGSRGTSLEVLSMNTGTKHENNMTTVQPNSCPNYPVKW